MTGIHIVPTLEDNYTYVLQNGRNALIVDCGEAEPVIDFLAKQNLTPLYLIITHHHDDHIAGIGKLKKRYPQLQVYAPEKDRDRIGGVDEYLWDNEAVTLGDFTFLCLETPGHTLNHLCFYFESLHAIFTGDTLFSMGCGRLFEGTPDQMYNSLQKLKTLPGATMIYCGHEYTKHNGEFGLSIEPENADILARMDKVEEMRMRSRPTLPVSLETELKTNLFLRAPDAKNFALLRQKRDNF